MSCPNEIEDEIYAELEAKLGRGATFEEYRAVAERLPEIVSRRGIKQIVERLVIENATQAFRRKEKIRTAIRWISFKKDCHILLQQKSQELACSVRIEELQQELGEE